MTASLEIPDFERLFKNHHKRLCNLSYKIVGEKDTSEDLVQELFIRIWKKKEVLEIADMRNYLNRSIVNASLNYLKSVKHRRLITPLEVLSDVESNETEEQLKLRELRNKIDLAIKKLPPKCQTIFALSRFEQMSSKEIADHLGLSKKTVDNQIGIALSKLRNELKPYLVLSMITLLMLLLLFILIG